MAPTTVSDLDVRVRGLESRVKRTEEDVDAISTTVLETHQDVRFLRRAVQALLDDRGLTVPLGDDE